MTRDEALNGSIAPGDILQCMALVELPFVDLSGQAQTGQMVVHYRLVDELIELFGQLAELKFPVASMKPASAFGWKDELSMEANNSSGFNYRFIAGIDKLSVHSVGAAIDLNPLFNPYDSRRGVLPQGSVYDPARPGTIVAGSPVVNLFASYGWVWLGDRAEYPDRHHFEKAEFTL
jgi:peptidoglycan LD-endopeptidase CwlK